MQVQSCFTLPRTGNGWFLDASTTLFSSNICAASSKLAGIKCDSSGLDEPTKWNRKRDAELRPISDGFYGDETLLTFHETPSFSFCHVSKSEGI